MKHFLSLFSLLFLAACGFAPKALATPMPTTPGSVIASTKTPVSSVTPQPTRNAKPTLTLAPRYTVTPTEVPPPEFPVSTQIPPKLGSSFQGIFRDDLALLTLYPGGVLSPNGKSIDIIGDIVASLYFGGVYTETLQV